MRASRRSTAARSGRRRRHGAGAPRRRAGPRPDPDLAVGGPCGSRRAAVTRSGKCRWISESRLDCRSVGPPGRDGVNNSAPDSRRTLAITVPDAPAWRVRLTDSVRNDFAPRAVPALPPRRREKRTCPLWARVAVAGGSRGSGVAEPCPLLGPSVDRDNGGVQVNGQRAGQVGGPAACGPQALEELAGDRVELADVCQRNDRSQVPRVEGAREALKTSPVAPARSRAVSSIESPRPAPPR